MSDPSEYSGVIQIRDNGVEVIDAPKKSRISLDLLRGADARQLSLIGRYISVGQAGVTYFIDAVELTAQGVEFLIDRIDQNPNAEVISLPPKVVS